MCFLGKMVGLPDDFLSNKKGSIGGGVIQTCASECVLDCLLAARAQGIQKLKAKYGDELEETALLSKLMAYCSKEAHSCVEKAAMIGFVKLRSGRTPSLPCFGHQMIAKSSGSSNQTTTAVSGAPP